MSFFHDACQIMLATRMQRKERQLKSLSVALASFNISIYFFTMMLDEFELDQH